MIRASIIPLLLTTFAFGGSPVKLTKVSSPNKALVFEVAVPASLSDVWNAFATSQGLSTWLTPNATVDPRKGGEWTAHYPGGKTGGGTILDFIPQRELLIAAMAPEAFPTVRATGTRAKFEFKSLGPNSTLVRLTQTGWKEGVEWDKAYNYLADGNAQLLETLYRRFLTGPIDWANEGGGSK